MCNYSNKKKYTPNRKQCRFGITCFLKEYKLVLITQHADFHSFTRLFQTTDIQILSALLGLPLHCHCLPPGCTQILADYQFNEESVLLSSLPTFKLLHSIAVPHINLFASLVIYSSRISILPPVNMSAHLQRQLSLSESLVLKLVPWMTRLLCWPGVPLYPFRNSLKHTKQPSQVLLQCSQISDRQERCSPQEN